MWRIIFIATVMSLLLSGCAEQTVINSDNSVSSKAYSESTSTEEEDQSSSSKDRFPDELLAVEFTPTAKDIVLSNELTVLMSPLKEGYTLDDWMPYENHGLLLLQRNEETAYLVLYDLASQTGKELHLPNLQAYARLTELAGVEGAQIGLEHSTEWNSDNVQYELYNDDLCLVRLVDITYPPERADSGAWVILQDGTGTFYVRRDNAAEGEKGELWRADADGSNPRLVLNCMKEFGGGGIWSIATKGDYLCFDLTSNPYPGPSGQGILHIPTQKYFFHEGGYFPTLLMDGKMQLGGSTIMGSFGKPMSIYDFKTDTVTPYPYFKDYILFAASDHARYLGGVWSDYDAETVTVNAYDVEKELLYSETIQLPEQYRNYPDDINECYLSDDGKIMLYQYDNDEGRIYCYRIDWGKAVPAVGDDFDMPYVASTQPLRGDNPSLASGAAT